MMRIRFCQNEFAKLSYLPKYKSYEETSDKELSKLSILSLLIIGGMVGVKVSGKLQFDISMTKPQSNSHHAYKRKTCSES